MIIKVYYTRTLQANLQSTAAKKQFFHCLKQYVFPIEKRNKVLV